MRTGLLLLGVIGWAAVVWRLAWAVLRLLRHGAEGMFAADVADRRGDRGDITGMQEAAATRSDLSRARRRSAALVLFWLVLLVAPTLTATTDLLYALYAPLWLLRTTRSPRRSW